MTLILNGTDNSATTPAVTGTDTDTGIYYPTSNQVAIATAGTQAMLVDASQNVTFAQAANLPNTFGFKNRIINGAANIYQRGTTFSSINNSITYGADRFFAFTTGATAQAQMIRSTSVPTGFLYSQQFGRAVSNTIVNQQFLCQCIESSNMLDLVGETVTLSFWAKAGANYSGGSLSIKLSTGTTADQSSATFSAGPCTGYTGNQAAINTTQAITTTFTKYTFTSSAIQAGALSMGLGIGYTPTGTAGADDNVYITGVQLEKGSTATSFDYRSIGTEFALCQRYYEQGGINQRQFITGVGQMTTKPWAYRVTKRATPTVVIAGGYTADGWGTYILETHNNPTGSHDLTNILGVTCTSTSSSNTGAVVACTVTVSSEL
jgi:hypothetical protein